MQAQVRGSEGSSSGGPELALRLGHGAPVLELAFSPDGKLLVSGGRDGSLLLWDAASGMWLRELPRQSTAVGYLGFTPDGRFLLSEAGRDLFLWETRTWQFLHALPGEYSPLVFDDSGSQLLARDCQNVVRMDLGTGRVVPIPLEGLAWDQWGERAYINAISVSADLSTIAASIIHPGPEIRCQQTGRHSSRERRAELLIWDLETGKLRKKYAVPTFLPSRRWDPEGKRWVRTRGNRIRTETLALSQNGDYLAVSGGPFWVCDVRGGRPARVLSSGGAGISPVWLPDGHRLAAGTTRHRVKLWDVHSGALLWGPFGHMASLGEMTISPDEECLASAGYDRTLRLWRMDDGACVWQSPGAADVLSVRYLPDGRGFITGHGDGGIRFWDAATGRLIRTLRTRHARVTTLELSRDGRRMLSDSSEESTHRTVEVWDTCSGARVFRHPIRGAYRSRTTFTPDGSLMFVCDGGATYAWDIVTDTLAWEVDGCDAAVSPDGKWIATSKGWDMRLRLWDAKTGSWQRDIPAHDGVLKPRFSPDSSSLACGFIGFNVALWDPETGERCGDVRTRADSVDQIAFSHDGTRMVVAGSYDECASLHDLPIDQKLTLLDGHRSRVHGVDFSPDGRRVVTASEDGTIRIWDAVTTQLQVTLAVLPGAGDEPSDEWIAYTPDHYYDGSPDAEQWLVWQDGTEQYPADALAGRFRRPDVIAERLR